MKLTPISAFPLTGTYGPTVFTAPGLTNIARSRVVPIAPRTAASIGVAVGLANAAQLWKLLTPTDQALWAAYPYGAGTPYAAFVQYNTNLLQWGIASTLETPYLLDLPSIVFAALYAEPDGIHTTLVVAISGPPGPGQECWIRLYINFNQTSFGTGNSSAAATYFGSFGPLTATPVNYFDVTDLMAANAGQWWYPGNLDTTSRTTCGNSTTCFYWTTDQYGMPSNTVGDQPTIDQGCGIAPPLIGPGICPFQPGPPYPWPISTAFY